VSESQLLQYLFEWKGYLSTFQDDVEINLKNILDVQDGRLVTVIANFNETLSRQQHSLNELDAEYNHLQNQVASLLADITSYHEQKQKDKSHLKQEITKLKNSAYERTKNAIKVSKPAKENRKSHNRDELLRQLEMI
jgi:hypothetical protein